MSYSHAERANVLAEALPYIQKFNGKTVVVMSTDKLSFHDFSQALVDLGVSNAIYLIGSSSYGFGRTANGDRFIFGKPVENVPENFSFIVWR